MPFTSFEAMLIFDTSVMVAILKSKMASLDNIFYKWNIFLVVQGIRILKHIVSKNAAKHYTMYVAYLMANQPMSNMNNSFMDYISNI